MAKKETTKKAPAKKAPAKKATSKKLTFERSKKYKVEAVASPYLVKGKEYEVTGEIAELLVNSGQAKLK